MVLEVPPRLYVILARQAPVAVVVRRGPARWARLSLWHTDTDEVEPGQWFHGRIYERRCDLSPSGRYFAYFALKYTPRTLGSDYKGTWTAVSRPPFLTALALWPRGHTWGGGALFESERSLLLNDGHDYPPHPEHQPPRWLKVGKAPSAGRGEDEPIESLRLRRDGWMREDRATLTRPAPAGGMLTRTYRGVRTRARRGQGGFHEEDFILTRANGDLVPLPDVTWADFDLAGRLVFAREGALYAAALRPKAPLRERLVHDFTDERPEPQAAPDWATRWK